MQHPVGRYMRAHGNTPGPTHRPKLAGALSGAAAAGLAGTVLWASGWIGAISRATGLRPWAVELMYLSLMALLGAVYGIAFGRGANDKQGGWLLGLSYGFLLWLLGPVVFLDWIVARPAATGAAALGMAGAQLLYGTALGVVFPYIHDLIQRELRAI